MRSVLVVIALPGCSVVEHAAECWAIHVTGVNCEANDPAGVLIHNNHHPVAFQQDGFTAE